MLLEIYDGANTWKCLDNPCDLFRHDVALINVASIAEEIDPFTRHEIGRASCRERV